MDGPRRWRVADLEQQRRGGLVVGRVLRRCRQVRVTAAAAAVVVLLHARGGGGGGHEGEALAAMKWIARRRFVRRGEIECERGRLEGGLDRINEGG